MLQHIKKEATVKSLQREAQLEDTALYQLGTPHTFHLVPSVPYCGGTGVHPHQMLELSLELNKGLSCTTANVQQTLTRANQRPHQFELPLHEMARSLVHSI
jgi:hypothetical protein